MFYRDCFIYKCQLQNDADTIESWILLVFFLFLLQSQSVVAVGYTDSISAEG